MVDRKAQRLGKNSVERAVKGFANANDDVPLPIGISLRSEEEWEIWGAFTRARAREDWRDMDLILLAKVVRLEADIRKHNDLLERSSVLISNKKGTLIENPILRVIDTLQRQQLAIIRSMSLNQTGSDPRTINNNAKSDDETRRLLKGNWAESLLALPN